MSLRVFVLSPAHCGGRRAQLLLRDEARFELALKLRAPGGATIGEAFSFLSGLYFRGKLAYATHFSHPPAEIASPPLVITTCRGLLPADTPITLGELREMGQINIDAADPRYRRPLARSAAALQQTLGDRCDVVLLGSIASEKYIEVLLEHFGQRLCFPVDFVGRGDMSRGGLMLRCVAEDRELPYAPVATAIRRGQRPPKLQPRSHGGSSGLQAPADPNPSPISGVS